MSCRPFTIRVDSHLHKHTTVLRFWWKFWERVQNGVSWWAARAISKSFLDVSPPRWFPQEISNESGDDSKGCRMILDDPRWTEMDTHDPRWSQMSPDDARYFQMSSKWKFTWCQIFPDDATSAEVLPNHIDLAHRRCHPPSAFSPLPLPNNKKHWLG